MIQDHDTFPADNHSPDEIFRHIFLQAGDGIFLIDRQGVITEANPRGCEMLGYPLEELVGKPVMSLHPADEIEHIVTELGRLDVEKLIVIESAFLRKDGLRIDVEITGRLLPDNQIVGTLRDISERKRMEKNLQALATTDPLTGLFNRRHFFEMVGVILQEAARYEQPVTVMMCDIDNFKQINDVHGHIVGDLALLHVVSAIKYSIRAADIASRFGGDEFMILMPQTDINQAGHFAERLCAYLSTRPVQETGIFLTLSIGVASMFTNRESISINLLLENADRALYQAKEQGRNQACFYQDSELG